MRKEVQITRIGYTKSDLQFSIPEELRSVTKKETIRVKATNKKRVNVDAYYCKKCKGAVLHPVAYFFIKKHLPCECHMHDLQSICCLYAFEEKLKLDNDFALTTQPMLFLNWNIWFYKNEIMPPKRIALINTLHLLTTNEILLRLIKLLDTPVN